MSNYDDKPVNKEEKLGLKKNNFKASLADDIDLDSTDSDRSFRESIPG